MVYLELPDGISEDPDGTSEYPDGYQEFPDGIQVMECVIWLRIQLVK